MSWQEDRETGNEALCPEDSGHKEEARCSQQDFKH